MFVGFWSFGIYVMLNLNVKSQTITLVLKVTKTETFQVLNNEILMPF